MAYHAEEQVKLVKERIWEQFVDGAHADDPLDEDAALALLTEYYAVPAHRDDKEIFYLGVLLFEMAFEREEKKRLYFARAKQVFEMYRAQTGETDWEVVEDRLEDVNDFLQTLNADDLAELFALAEQELSGGAGPGGEGGAARSYEPGDMVLIPAGDYLFGPGKMKRELPAYYIDVYPVTNDDYRRFIDATGYRPPKFWAEKRLNRGDAPVVGVSWSDAKRYAAWAGKDLPTWEQWEKAARGTDGRLFPWGDEGPDAAKANFARVDGSDSVAPVTQHDGNVSPFGVRGMAGNVWEWTNTQDIDEREMIVLCGGSWCDPEDFLRLDQHLFANPKDKMDIVGFRCAKPV